MRERERGRENERERESVCVCVWGGGGVSRKIRELTQNIRSCTMALLIAYWYFQTVLCLNI